MANEKNLKPIRSKDEAREKGKKGGVASGKKRRQQKTYREMAKAMLSAKIVNDDLLAELKAFGIENTDVKAYTLLGMIKASGGGSHHAFDRLMELTGEKDQTENKDVIEKLDKVLNGIDEVMNND